MRASYPAIGHVVRAVLLALALVLAPRGASAQTFPKLTGRVVDAANLLTPEQEQQLTALSDGVEQASSRQLVIATVPSLQDYPIEDYGYKLGRAWGIGQKNADNGIILIVAPTERRVRIEVGYGLEPIMTDALSSSIISGAILPRFRANDYPGGISAGAQAIAEQLKLPPEEAETRAATTPPPLRRSRSSNNDAQVIGFAVLIVVFFVIPMIFNRRRGRRYRGGSAPVILWGPGLSDGGWSSGWGGDSGGGGGFSGGGGSFGGGGSSGGW
ncbi:TPM domain-containing protein [uncultured Sphingomonas sp.]|uniref:TPM domain-containing protein n=1 Tax=uncultured Sphingomonas sp. TaxID=158754 RepID=UPI0035CC4522